MFKVFLTFFWIYTIITFTLAGWFYFHADEKDEKFEEECFNSLCQGRPEYEAVYNRLGGILNICLIGSAIPGLHLILLYFLIKTRINFYRIKRRILKEDKGSKEGGSK